MAIDFSIVIPAKNESENLAILLPKLRSNFPNTPIIVVDDGSIDDTKSVSILEINCDYPDGLLLHDKTYSALSGTKSTLHHDLLNQLFEEDEEVHVLHHPDAFFLDGYHAESENLNQTKRKGNLISDTSKLPSNSTVRMCLESSKLTEKNIEDLLASSPRLVNSVALRTLGYKDLLSSIDHPYVPKTTKVSKDNIRDFDNEHGDLVLKPADGCEGYGISFGKDMDKEKWTKTLSAVSDKNYVVQRSVHIPKKTVHLFDENTVVEKNLHYDICPHFFIKNGRVIGNGHTLMRFSENPIVNVTQGGGIGYYKA